MYCLKPPLNTPYRTPPYTKARVFLYILPFLAVVGALQGCAPSQKQPILPPFMHEAAFTQKNTFWRQQGCTLSATHSMVTLTTMAEGSSKFIRFSVAFPPLINDEGPKFSLQGIKNVTLNPVGRQQHWAFELLNTPYTTAHMLNGAYINIRYRPARTHNTPSPEAENAIFPLHALPQALLNLYEACPAFTHSP